MLRRSWSVANESVLRWLSKRSSGPKTKSVWEPLVCSLANAVGWRLPNSEKSSLLVADMVAYLHRMLVTVSHLLSLFPTVSRRRTWFLVATPLSCMVRRLRAATLLTTPALRQVCLLLAEATCSRTWILVSRWLSEVTRSHSRRSKSTETSPAESVG